MAKDWRRLVTELQSRGEGGEHLERLRAHLNTDEQQELLEHEVRSEIAKALGRAEMKVIAALLALRLADHEVDEADDAARQPALARREACRQQALAARQDYKIHREAVGIRRNGHIDKLYVVPPPRRS